VAGLGAVQAPETQVWALVTTDELMQLAAWQTVPLG
jgi:hypothetical protein